MSEILIPTFIENAVEFGPGENPTDPPNWITRLRDTWWCSQETAVALAKRYGARTVPMPPYYPAEWRRVAFLPAMQWYLQFPDGTLINAGILADFFRINPEEISPGVADRNVKLTISMEEASH